MFAFLGAIIPDLVLSQCKFIQINIKKQRKRDKKNISASTFCIFFNQKESRMAN